MKHILLFCFLITAFGCSSKPQVEAVRSCFLLYNLKTDKFEKEINQGVCKERYPAYSSFKVPLAVMAFDAKVLKDEKEVLKWNGIKESREVLNQDHDAKSWMKDSVVWFSQRITPRLGKEKIQKYLRDFNYGNQDISSGITDAWLVSPSEKNEGLRISGYEQIEFLKKLWRNELPVSKRSMELTRKITYLETSPKGIRLSGKTGSNFYDKEKKFHSGWFIAHIQQGDQEYVAVTNINDVRPYSGQDVGGPRAKELMKKLLAQEGLW